MRKILGLLAVLTLLPLTTSCGKTKHTSETKIIKTKQKLELVTCHSDGSYTECSVLNRAIRISHVDAYRNEDCRLEKDYYLLNEKVLVTRNGCRGEFLLEVK